MDYEKSIQRLSLFGIPEDTNGVREILGRLVQTEAISLGEIQTIRDLCAPVTDENLLSALFAAVMFLSLHGGNTFLAPSKGENLLKAGIYLEQDEENNENFGKQAGQLWPKAVSAAEKLPKEFVVGENGGWFFQRNHEAVRAVTAGFSTIAKAQAETCVTIQEDDAALQFGFRLNAGQINAVNSAANHVFTVITGGPGTGKTTIVCAILRYLMREMHLTPQEIALAAPTGRAAQRMSESLRKQCKNALGNDEKIRSEIENLTSTTIHTLLGGFPPHWKHNRDNKLTQKLIVVDESSMVDVHLMKALLEAFPERNCRLVLLGDKDQLPSVEAGAVLGDIVCEHGIPDIVVRLTESNRFSGNLKTCAECMNAGGKIPAVELQERRAGWSEYVKEAKNECFTFSIRKNTPAAFYHERLLEWSKTFGLLNSSEGKSKLIELASADGWEHDPAILTGNGSERSRALFAELDRSRILTTMRSGALGVQGINRFLLKKRLEAGKNMILPSHPLMVPGIPIMITRNTPKRNLWNGDIGVTVQCAGRMETLFPRGENAVKCPVGLLPEYDIAYAVTIHKSQGSEFENVLVLLPDDEKNPLLSRPLLYTGITRAKKCAVIMSSPESLSAAIRRELTRDTGIRIEKIA